MENNKSEINQYSCDEILFSKREEIWNLRILKKEYELFIEDIETFFNSQTSEEDLKMFKGEIFELSDQTEDFFFPFRVSNSGLKFVETESWRTLIMTALLLTKIQNRVSR